MESINLVLNSSIIVDLVIALILIISTYIGHRKGLTDVIFKILIIIVSIVAAFALYKPVSNFIIEKTLADEWLNERIGQTLMGTSISEGELITQETTNISKGFVEFINSFVQEGINEAKGNIVEFVAEKLAYFILTMLTLIFLIIIIRICLGFARSIAKIITNLPIIKTVDKLGGTIYGIIRGLLIIYIIFAVISIISPVIARFGILKFINDSYLGSIMYNNNLLLNLVLK